MCVVKYAIFMYECTTKPHAATRTIVVVKIELNVNAAARITSYIQAIVRGGSGGIAKTIDQLLLFYTLRTLKSFIHRRAAGCAV